MSLLKQSGQMWKIHLFLGMLVTGSLATMAQTFLTGSLGRELTTQIAVGGVGLIIGSFIWAVQAIICPKCQLKLFVHAFRNQGFFSWFAWLLQLEVCPKCSHGETPRSTTYRKKTKGLKRP